MRADLKLVLLFVGFIATCAVASWSLGVDDERRVGAAAR